MEVNNHALPLHYNFNDAANLMKTAKLQQHADTIGTAGVAVGGRVDADFCRVLRISGAVRGYFEGEEFGGE